MYGALSGKCHEVHNPGILSVFYVLFYNRYSIYRYSIGIDRYSIKFRGNYFRTTIWGKV